MGVCLAADGGARAGAVFSDDWSCCAVGRGGLGAGDRGGSVAAGRKVAVCRRVGALVAEGCGVGCGALGCYGVSWVLLRLDLP